MAENGGFEPPIELSPYNGLAILSLYTSQRSPNHLQPCCPI